MLKAAAKVQIVHTAILIIIEVQFQVIHRFSSGKLVLTAVENCFVAFNYYENGSTVRLYVAHQNSRTQPLDLNPYVLSLGHYELNPYVYSLDYYELNPNVFSFPGRKSHEKV